MKAIGMTTMKHRLTAEGVKVVKCSNIRINGDLRGCSGFVRGECGFVYFTTEPPCQNYGFNGGASMMYRMAKDERDYCGGTNRWCRPDDLAREVAKLANWGNNPINQ